MSLEEQLRKDAESMREVGWFNRAKMYTAAADEIHRLQDRIKRLEEALDCLTLVVGLTPIAGNKDALQEAFDLARAALRAKEAKP